jgi:tetratricopeptide (TPR) repeat protein/predicted Ser/Thr protein kinase
VETPKQIGPYEVVRELARGGQGVVYEARKVGWNHRAAVKLLFDRDPDAVRRFRREATTLARLSHPHLLRVQDQGEADGVPFLALELIEGQDLSKQIDAKGLPPVERTVEVLVAVAAALQHCHEHGIVHRDMKPHNVLIEAGTGRPVVLDLGMAKRDFKAFGPVSQESLTRLTQEGEVLGTPSYMAPEQVDPAFGEVDARTDVYALGATLFHCLTGNPPFLAPSALNVLLRVVEEPPPDPREQTSDAPAHLAELCMRAMAKDQAQRPASAAEFAQLLAAEPTTSPAPLGGGERLRRGPLAALGALLALAAALLVAAIAVQQGKGPAESPPQGDPQPPEVAATGEPTSAAPERTEAQVLLAEARRLLEVGDGAGAVEAAQAALASDSDPAVAAGARLVLAEVRLREAWVAREKVRPRVLAEVQQALRWSPTNADALALQAYAYLTPVDQLLLVFRDEDRERLNRAVDAALSVDPRHPRALLVAAVRKVNEGPLNSTGQAPEVLELLDRALEGASSPAARAELLAYRGRVVFYAARSDRSAGQRAREDLKEALAAYPPGPLYERDRAAVLVLRGDLYDYLAKEDRKRADLEAALKLEPKLAAAHYNLGTLHQDQGRASEALDAYRQAIKGDAPLSVYHQAYLLLRLEGEAPQPQDLLECWPIAARGVELLRREEPRAGKNDRLQELLRQCELALPLEQLLVVAHDALARGEWPRAIEVATLAEERASAGSSQSRGLRAKALLIRAEARLWKDPYDPEARAKARADVDQALALRPDDVTAQGLRLYARLRPVDGVLQQPVDEAGALLTKSECAALLADAERVLALDPTEPSACLALAVAAEALRTSGPTGEASLATLDRALRRADLRPARRAELETYRGYLVAYTVDNQRGAEALRAAIDACPPGEAFDRRRARAWAILGHLQWEKLQDPAAGTESLRQALALAPDCSPALSNRGRLRDAAGDHVGALEDVRAAMAGDHPLAEYSVHFAQAVLRHHPGVERYAEAIEAVKEGQALDAAGRHLARETGELLESFERRLSRLHKAKRFRNGGRWGPAMAQAKNVLQSPDPDTEFEALLVHAEALLWSGVWRRDRVRAEALKGLDRALELRPDDPRALGLRAYARLDAMAGVFLLFLGDDRERVLAHEDAKGAEERDPDNHHAHVVQAVLRANLGSGREGIGLEDVSASLCRLELAARVEGRLDFRRAEALSLVAVRSAEAVALEGERVYPVTVHEQSHPRYRDAANAYPKPHFKPWRAALLGACGRRLTQTTKPELARAELERALTIADDDASALQALAGIEYEQDREGALKRLQKALAGGDPLADHASTFARYSLKKGRRPTRRELERILEVLDHGEALLREGRFRREEVHRSDLLYQRARVLGRLRRRDAALEHVKRALAEAPDGWANQKHAVAFRRRIESR